MAVLLLGGTAEARALAARLHPDVDVVSSLAGRVPDPALPVGRVRVGGFGGEAAMAQWLRVNAIDAVIDATHPFAAAITDRTARVCARLGLAHAVLVRPAWDPGAAEQVASTTHAARVVVQCGYSRVFLSTGRGGVAAFQDCPGWFLIRVVTDPDADILPARHLLVYSRGPYRYEDELALLREHRVQALVTKNSGGEATRAKLDAAATLGVPVIMVRRPALPAGVHTVATVEQATAWLAAASG